MIEPVDLARRFSEELRKQLGKKVVLQIIELNEKESNSEVCHSHDFCDGNQVMLDAMALFGLDFETALISLINDAWDSAKSNKFWIEDDPTDDSDPMDGKV